MLQNKGKGRHSGILFNKIILKKDVGCKQLSTSLSIDVNVGNFLQRK